MLIGQLVFCFTVNKYHQCLACVIWYVIDLLLIYQCNIFKTTPVISFLIILPFFTGFPKMSNKNLVTCHENDAVMYKSCTFFGAGGLGGGNHQKLYTVKLEWFNRKSPYCMLSFLIFALHTRTLTRSTQICQGTCVQQSEALSLSGKIRIQIPCLSKVIWTSKV